jgi:hypothetical protein
MSAVISTGGNNNNVRVRLTRSYQVRHPWNCRRRTDVFIGGIGRIKHQVRRSVHQLIHARNHKVNVIGQRLDDSGLAGRL